MTTENNNLGVKYYTKDYAGVFKTVFGAKSAFAGAFQDLQIETGISHNSTAFSVKTNNTPLVIGTYNTGANVGMGTGTSSSSRFGNMTEIIYADTDVPYSYTFSVNEGFDNFTVNNDLETAIADRMILNTEAQIRQTNVRSGAFISANAGHTEALATVNAEAISNLFDAVDEYMVNEEVAVPYTAYIVPTIYHTILNMALATNSPVTIGEDNVPVYKGIRLEKTPANYFAQGDGAYFIPDQIFIHFLGIETTYVHDVVDDFYGKSLKAAGKGGSYVNDDNKKAIVKVTLPKI